MTLPQKVPLCAAGSCRGAVQRTPPYARQQPSSWHYRTEVHSKTCTEHHENSTRMQHRFCRRNARAE